MIRPGPSERVAPLGTMKTKTKEVLRLNLGCRDKQIPGFKGMDIDIHRGVDYVGDVSDLSRFADNSVFEIFASHILEHFPHPRTLSVLKEWNRVLVPGGILYVGVPDLARVVEITCAVGLTDWAVNYLVGDQGYDTAYHYNIFDEHRLRRYLMDAGFKRADKVERLAPSSDNDCSNLISTYDGRLAGLNMEAIK